MFLRNFIWILIPAIILSGMRGIEPENISNGWSPYFLQSRRITLLGDDIPFLLNDFLLILRFVLFCFGFY
jgi:hypothetical protein